MTRTPGPLLALFVGLMAMNAACEAPLDTSGSLPGPTAPSPQGTRGLGGSILPGGSASPTSAQPTPTPTPTVPAPVLTPSPTPRPVRVLQVLLEAPFSQLYVPARAGDTGTPANLATRGTVLATVVTDAEQDERRAPRSGELRWSAFPTGIVTVNDGLVEVVENPPGTAPWEVEIRAATTDGAATGSLKLSVLSVGGVNVTLQSLRRQP
ncbi:MAG: hypothetical protein VKP72_03960 [bacterium]|nr:hypothetical protein [bacterium]